LVSAFLALSIASFVVIGGPHNLVQARAADLVAAQGGDCYDCQQNSSDDCTTNSCVKIADGVWRQTIGMKASGISCFVVVRGATTCLNNTPKVCVKKRTCTQEKCPDGSCGPPSTNEIDTNCRPGAYLCKF